MDESDILDVPPVNFVSTELLVLIFIEMVFTDKRI
jgi:hypothetical protein